MIWPASASFSSRRATICSDVSPSGDGEGVLHHLAFDDGVDHVGKLALFGELIFAVLELAARLEHDHAAHENVWLIDHAFALQQVGNVPNAETARNIDDLVLGERTGRLEPLLADEQAGADRDGDHHEQREDRISDDHERMAHAPANGGSAAVPVPARARRADCAAMAACAAGGPALSPPGR